MKTLIIAGLIVIGIGIFWYGNRPSAPDLATTGEERNSAMLATTTGMQVSASDIEYFGATSGFYARPQAEGNYPGVVMIHEWWGLNDNIRDTARQLAAQGYAVLAVDLYDGVVASTTDEARRLTTGLDQARALENLKAAKQYLTDRGSERIASLGWCFGGGQSLQLATSGVKLDATVIYYGQLTSDEERLKNITWPVLGIFGETDTSIPTTSVRAFESALDSLDIENEVVIYPGVGHAFANPSGMNYAPAPTRDAWEKTLAFLNENLK